MWERQKKWMFTGYCHKEKEILLAPWKEDMFPAGAGISAGGSAAYFSQLVSTSGVYSNCVCACEPEGIRIRFGSTFLG